jgi:hypothetical protein
LDEAGTACSRIELTAEGIMQAKGGARYGGLGKYEAGKVYHVEVELSVSKRTATFFVDGKKAGQRMFYAPVKAIERIMFRTGSQRTFPDVDTPADWDGILDHAGEQAPKAVFRIAHVKTVSTDENAGAAFLKYQDFKHYVDDFNTMEPEGIVQAIPNDKAWEWMKENVPLFECSQKNFEEIYWFRWWTLRKHLRKTDDGKYAMTEFLVNRSYADKYNLIASGVGHHIHEARWLRNPKYLDEVMETWYRGNGGQPMKKIWNYSSWMPASLWDRYLVDGRKDWIIGMLPDLEREYQHWDTTHRWIEDGQRTLFWQADVQDAMEETISGGRKKQYARPSINSYMYGNARAIAHIAALKGDEALAQTYNQHADTIKTLVENRLWNGKQQFFETLRKDSSSNVREAIGFLPWYFNLPSRDVRYEKAWLQLADVEGFSAPYGLTTAERRHPQFRSHGVGKCEWDGAVWPFATSQTLTALANYLYERRSNQIYPKLNQVVQMDSVFFDEMEKYVQSQHMRGKPYIGEYLDETTGFWLKGDQERSRYYNHSTFCDLVISGLVGLRPQAGNKLQVCPLIPQGKWDWFCLDRVRYHGHDITILWDKDGSRYHVGKGLFIFVDGEKKAHREILNWLSCEL